MGMLMNIGAPIILGVAISIFTGMNIIFAAIIAFIIFYAARFIMGLWKKKPTELVFKDHYEEIASELIEGSVRSCPEGEFQCILKGSQIFGIPSNLIGNIIGMCSIRRYTIENHTTEKPGFKDMITVKITDPEGNETTQYKFYDDVIYGLVVVSPIGLKNVFRKSMNILLPLGKVSPLSKYTVMDGFAVKCISKKKQLYVLEWEEKDEIYNEIEERVLQDSLYQKRNIELVNISANANELAAKLNSPTMIAKEAKAVDV